MILMRLCPFIPFFAYNLAFSLTNISYKSFAVGLLGMIPCLSLRIFVGSTLSYLINNSDGFINKHLTKVILIILIFCAIGAIILIRNKTKNYLNSQLNFNEDDSAIELKSRLISGS
jgi:uncharacterized membrane protein YdjX (TVP38/TMEM64 family)